MPVIKTEDAALAAIANGMIFSDSQNQQYIFSVPNLQDASDNLKSTNTLKSFFSGVKSPNNTKTHLKTKSGSNSRMQTSTKFPAVEESGPVTEDSHEEDEALKTKTSIIDDAKMNKTKNIEK